MSVQIHRKFVEEAGTRTTAKGEEPVWKIRFTIKYQGTNDFSFDLNFEVVGPAGAAQAEEAAYEELRIFLQEASKEVTNRTGM
jgi:hypothetical protein